MPVLFAFTFTRKEPPVRNDRFYDKMTQALSRASGQYSMKLKKYGATEQKIYDLVKPITDELEFFIWDVCFFKEGAMWYLRVFIDRDEGITIDDCETATRPISEMLDRIDPIEQSYILEVGSAGLERELLKKDHFEVCIGDMVRVHFIRTVDGLKEISGVLNEFSNDGITLKCEDDCTKFFSFSDISSVKLYMDFE